MSGFTLLLAPKPKGIAASFVSVGVVWLSPQVTVAAPVGWSFSEGGNGHYYELVDANDIQWTDARDAAESMSCCGVFGHLATITSADEQAFIVANFAPGNEVGYRWLGGFQDTGSSDYAEPDGGWSWITGEAWSFTAWHSGEPNNSNPDHDFLRTWGSGPAEWEDFVNEGYDTRGFVVEYPVGCLGDVDGDLTVGFDDLNFILSAWGRADGDLGFIPEADLDGSGLIDFTDLNEVLLNWGESCS